MTSELFMDLFLGIMVLTIFMFVGSMMSLYSKKEKNEIEEDSLNEQKFSTRTFGRPINELASKAKRDYLLTKETFPNS